MTNRPHSSTRRFWGVNLAKTAAVPNEGFANSAAWLAQRIAARVVAAGFDRVRLHLVDGPSTLGDGAGGIDPAKLPRLRVAFDAYAEAGLDVHLSLTWLRGGQKGMPATDQAEAERRWRNAHTLVDAVRDHAALAIVELANEEGGHALAMADWYERLEQALALPDRVGVVWTQGAAASPIQDAHWYGVHPLRLNGGVTWADEIVDDPRPFIGRPGPLGLLVHTHTRPGGIVSEWGSSLATRTLPEAAADLIQAMRHVGALGAYYWCLGQTPDEALGNAVPRDPFSVGPRSSLLRTLGALGRAWHEHLDVGLADSALLIDGVRYPWHELSGSYVAGKPGQPRAWNPGEPPEVNVSAEPARRGILSRFFSLFRN